MQFTTEDADRLLGLADQFMEDWEQNEGKGDPECIERRAEWDAIRPLLVQAPALLQALQDIVPNVPGYNERDFAGRPWLQNAMEAIAKERGRQ